MRCFDLLHFTWMVFAVSEKWVLSLIKVASAGLCELSEWFLLLLRVGRSTPSRRVSKHEQRSKMIIERSLSDSKKYSLIVVSFAWRNPAHALFSAWSTVDIDSTKHVMSASVFDTAVPFERTNAMVQWIQMCKLFGTILHHWEQAIFPTSHQEFKIRQLNN